MRKIFSLFVALMAVLQVAAQGYSFKRKGIYYSVISNGKIGVVSVSDSPYSGSLDIPATLEYAGTSLEVVKASLSGDIQSVTFNGSLESLEISNVPDIPSIVANGPISSFSLSSCENSSTLSVPTGATKVSISKCPNLSSVSLPNGVKNLTIADCPSLSDMSLPDGVQSCKISGIGASSVSLPSSVETADLSGCEGLLRCDVPASAQSVDVPTNTSIYYAGTLENWLFNVKRPSDYVYKLFIDNKQVEGKLVVPQTVTDISKIFDGLDGMTELDIHDNVRVVSVKNCPSLVSISIPSNAIVPVRDFNSSSVVPPFSSHYWECDAFSGCSSLTEIKVASDSRYYTCFGGVLYGKSVPLQFIAGTKTIFLPSEIVSFASASGTGKLGLKNVKEIVVDEDNEEWTSVDGVLYDKSVTTLLQVPGRFEGQVVVPETVTGLGFGCLFYHSNSNGISIKTTSATPPSGLQNCRGWVQTTGKIPFYIPKGSLAAYEYADSYSNFNFIEYDPGDVFTTLSVQVSSHGSISCDGAAVNSGAKLDVKVGSSKTFTITPDKGYTVASVVLNGEDVTNKVANGSFTTDAISSASTLVVTFEEAPFRIEMFVVGSGARFVSLVKMGQDFLGRVEDTGEAVVTKVTLDGADVTTSALSASGVISLANVSADHVIIVYVSAGNSTNLKGLQTDADITAWRAASTVFVEATADTELVEVIDLSGRVIASSAPSAYGVVTFPVGQGMVIVRATMASGAVATRKL